MRLEAKEIEKWYFRGKGDSNRFFAVNRTDLVLEPGKVTVLTGRSGSGKTTLMHILAGLLTPSAGQVLIGMGEPAGKEYPISDGSGQTREREQVRDDRTGQMGGQQRTGVLDLYAMDDEALSRFRNAHLGMIPQGAGVLPNLTVMENILLPRGIYRDTRSSAASAKTGAHDRILALLDRLGIADLANVMASELSGGERRRLAVVRALAGCPDIIFADEPTSDLDDENMDIVLRMLREAADAGAAVLIVTHDSEALDFADVALRMHAGEVKIISQADMADAIERQASCRAAAEITSPPHVGR